MRPDSNKLHYIAVEGSLGVGKTELARMLARTFEARLVLEHVDDNPFLERFYQDMQSYAFQTQLYFLLDRFRQQQTLHQLDLFSQGLVSDYVFAKDRIFAYATLSEDELVLYEKLYQVLQVKVVRPTLTIFLQADPEVLLQRIQTRGRAFERPITSEYLMKVNKVYSEFFFYYKDSPLLVINTSHIDFVHSPLDYEDLVREIHEVVRSGAGTKYYVPATRA